MNDEGCSCLHTPTPTPPQTGLESKLNSRLTLRLARLIDTEAPGIQATQLVASLLCSFRARQRYYPQSRGTLGGTGRGDSPGHLHQRQGHGGGVDGQVSIQVDDDADVEHVDAHWNTKRRTSAGGGGGNTFILISPANASRSIMVDGCASNWTGGGHHDANAPLQLRWGRGWNVHAVCLRKKNQSPKFLPNPLAPSRQHIHPAPGVWGRGGCNAPAEASANSELTSSLEQSPLGGRRRELVLGSTTGDHQGESGSAHPNKLQ